MAQILQKSVVRQSSELNADGETLQNFAKRSDTNGAILTDVTGKIIWVNQTFCHITGYESAELIGRNPRLLASGVHPKVFYEELWSTILSGKTWQGVVVNKNKDGSLGTHQTTISPISDSDGKLIYFLGLKEFAITDIELEESNLFISAAIEHADDAILLANLEGQVSYANCSFFALFGTHATGIITKPLTQLFSQDQSAIPGNERELNAMLQHGWIETFQIGSTDKDRKQIRMRICQVRDEKHHIIGFACYFHDLGEEERILEEKNLMEIRLRQAQKLEAIGQLAAGVAHEINTPTQYVGDNLHFLGESISALMEIATTAQGLLAADDSGISGPGREKLLNLIEEADIAYLVEELPASIEQATEGVQRIAEIVNAMKMFSHPGSRERTLMNVNEALKMAATVTRNEWKYNAGVTFDLDEKIEPLPCHPREINQVFLNILINAAHAVNEAVACGKRSQGTITIATQNFDDFIEIRLSDNALGIPEGIRERVFDPFFTTKEVGKGTGQGLAISYDVVTSKHGGKLFFESIENEGTTFFIRLPKDAGKQAT